MTKTEILGLLVVWLVTLVGASYSARQGTIDPFLAIIGNLPALPAVGR